MNKKTKNKCHLFSIYIHSPYRTQAKIETTEKRKRDSRKRKRWLKELCRRRSHLNTINNRPVLEQPEDEVHREQNFKKTKTFPCIWWAENSKHRLNERRYTYDEWVSHQNFARQSGLDPCPTSVELSPSEQTRPGNACANTERGRQRQVGGDERRVVLTERQWIQDQLDKLAEESGWKGKE